MARRISLVNRTIVVFTIASIGIVGGAVAVPWVALRQVAREIRREDFRRQVQRYGEVRATSDDSLRLVTSTALAEGASPLLEVFERLKRDGETFELLIDVPVDGRLVQRYVRAVRRSIAKALAEGEVVDLRPPSLPFPPDDPIEALIVIDRPANDLEALVRAKRLWTGVAAGLAVLALGSIYALLVRRDLLRPVRRLRDTVERVRKGEIGARSGIRSADEYQRLGESFNAMLDQFEQAQKQLRAINENLDLKLSELSEANVGLYESNRLKSEFLANVSHELRTPLNSIIGFAELLDELARNDPVADPKRRRYISHILSSGRSLLDMINELLSMAKIEAGRMEVVIEPTSVADLVEGIVTIMRPQAAARRIDVQVRVPAGLPTIETDPGKLQQILYNFLSNAIKFSPDGSEVTLGAERVVRSDGAAGVRITVHDRGPGVPQDMQETIFEKFRQVDASKTRQHSGTGLGLAICRELAHMLNAAVGLSSEPGQGSTFFVELSFEFRGRELPPLMGDG
ncbi:MAG: HAMP domain-containing protein [Phycisphaeraceae bacterium]|nr:HAMP domain-containing protein [Phycisphaeraceae bacterium]